MSSENVTSQNVVLAERYAAMAGINDDIVLEKFSVWRRQVNYTSDALSLYLSLYFYQNYVQFCRGITMQVLRFVFPLLGLLGYILEMAVLFQPEFNTISFSYFKAITAYETVVMIYIIRRPIFALIPRVTNLINTDPGWGWFDTIWLYALGEPQSFAADTLTMFVSFERVVALWFPRQFRMVNNVKFAIFAQVTSFVAGAIYWLNFKSFTSDNNGYPVWTDPLETDWAGFFVVKDSVSQIRGWIVLALSIAVSVGFFRLSRRQRHLADTDEVKERTKLNKQLALLSLACSIPVTFQCVMDLIYQNFLRDYADLDTAITLLSFDGAVKNARRATTATIFAVFVSVSFLLSHCTHFYTNFILSQRFRKGTLKVLRKWHLICGGGSVEPNKGNGNSTVGPVLSTRDTGTRTSGRNGELADVG